MTSDRPTIRFEDDLVLVKQVSMGNEAALDTLIGRYYQPLVNFLLQYTSSQDSAEDVIQELFVRLWERRTTWRISGTVKSYLYTSARNSALNFLKSSSIRHRNEQVASPLVETEAASGIGAQEQLELDELQAAVDAAVSSLPDRCREVFLLSRDHGLSYSEIAETLGLAQSTVRNQLARALSLLEQRLMPFLTFILAWLSYTFSAMI